MAKLKYLSIPDYYREDSSEYLIVPNPTSYTKVPNGIYHIRGNKKGLL